MKYKLKNTKYIIVTLFIMWIVAACSSDTDIDAGDSKGNVLRLGITQNDKNAEYEALLQFKEGVEERTNNEIKVETYHSDQLASVPDLIEQATVGTNVGTITDAAQLGDIKKEFSILQSPFTFENTDEIDLFLDSDLYQTWVDEFNEEGLQVLSFNFKLGDRNLATTKAVTSVDELSGKVIRTSGADIVDKTISAMGGAPSGMPWTEAYPGLEQGVIDGVEAHSAAIYESSMYEVIDHIAKTNHYQLVSSLVVSAGWFNELSEEQKEIVIDEAIKAGDLATEMSVEQTEDYEKEMKEYGVEFHQVDRDEFKKLTDSIYDELGLSDIREQVLEVLGK